LSRGECYDRGFDIEVMQGVRFHHTVRLKEYNYKTQKVELITPTQGIFEMTISKPNYLATLKLTHKQTKKEIVVPIKLTETDMFNLDKLKNDFEIKKYLIELSRKQRILKIDKDFDVIVNETKIKKTE
jgi:hypothetical protein